MAASVIRCLGLFIVFSLCFSGGFSTWWNPFEWRVYWIDWADKTHKEPRLEEETDFEIQPTQPLLKGG